MRRYHGTISAFCVALCASVLPVAACGGKVGGGAVEPLSIAVDPPADTPPAGTSSVPDTTAPTPLDVPLGYELRVIDGDLQNLALDDTTVYVQTPGNLFAVPRGGGAIIRLPSLTLAYLSSIAVDATHFYWAAAWSERTDGAGAIVRRPKAGGADETLATGLTGPMDVAVDDLNVYWTNFGSRVGDRSTITSVPKAGGAVKVLVDSPTPISGQTHRPTGDIFFVSWTASSLRGDIMRVPRLGGPATLFVSPKATALGGLIATNDFLAWTETTSAQSPTQISFAPQDGGAAGALEPADPLTSSLGANGDSLFFATSRPSTSSAEQVVSEVYRVRPGTAPRRLARIGFTTADDSRSAVMFVADSTRVFWVDTSSSTRPKTFLHSVPLR